MVVDDDIFCCVVLKKAHICNYGCHKDKSIIQSDKSLSIRKLIFLMVVAFAYF